MNRVVHWSAGLILLAASACPGQVRIVQSPLRTSALSLEQEGRLTEAVAAWQRLARTYPRDPEPYAHIGLLEARQGHYKTAIPAYRKALAVYPSATDQNAQALRLDLGLALFKADQPREAITNFKMLLKEEPADSPLAQRVTILTGMAYYGLAEYQEAAPYLKAASAREPNNLPLLLALAHSYLWSKQFKYVMGVYHQILTINPDSAEADMLAGEALDEMKDNAGAVKMFQAAVKADPKMPNAHFGLGYLLWAQKKFPEAAGEFQVELTINPRHVQSMLYLADADIQMNKMKEAEPLLVETLKLEPSLGLARLDLGIIYMESGRNQDALRELTAAAKLTPDDVNVHWRLGRLYRTMGRKEEAKLEFQKAANLNKAADEALYQKIANSRQHPPKGADAAAAGADKQP
ncbi:MAG TPA: tetratricopeptide repeat protein [Terracidiphilus sp.]|nr:tetratricopeptide repeat protein [Terracidiphilus sp.]